MKRPTGSYLYLTITACSLLSGCRDSATEWADSVTYTGVFRRDQERISTGHINDQVAVAVALRLPEGYWDSSGGAGAGPDPAFHFSESWRHPTQPDFNWRCEMSGTKTGTMTIDGNTFSLEKGRFFFVHVVDESIHLYQYDIDVTKLFVHKEAIMSETAEAPTLDQMFERIFPNFGGRLPPDISGETPKR